MERTDSEIRGSKCDSVTWVFHLWSHRLTSTAVSQVFPRYGFERYHANDDVGIILEH
jgi:hypothetical protein